MHKPLSQYEQTVCKRGAHTVSIRLRHIHFLTGVQETKLRKAKYTHLSKIFLIVPHTLPKICMWRYDGWYLTSLHGNNTIIAEQSCYQADRFPLPKQFENKACKGKLPVR
jgi:hypothetical protein